MQAAPAETVEVMHAVPDEARNNDMPKQLSSLFPMFSHAFSLKASKSLLFFV